MATWKMSRDGSWDYPTLGFRAAKNDILVAAKSPDVFWELIPDGPAETVDRYGAGDEPDFVEPADGSVLVYVDQNNRYEPRTPAEFLDQPSLDGLLEERIAEQVDAVRWATDNGDGTVSLPTSLATDNGDGTITIGV